MSLIRFAGVALVLLTGLFACQQQKLPQELVTLEAEVKKEPTNANVTKLLEAYTTWLQENTEKSDTRKAVLEKQLALSAEHLQYPYALSSLQTLLVDYPDDKNTPDRILQIGDILVKSSKEVPAEVLFQSFVVRYPDHPKSKDLAGKFPVETPVDSLIKNIGRSIFVDTAGTINESAARQYVDVCEAYALVNHGSNQAVEYLHKASETARTLRSTAKALSIYDWILRAYPNHPRAAQALFLKGFTYDNDLKDIETARAAYTEFLQRFPNDEFAPSAKFLLENLGKSDDELLDALQKRAATQDSVQ